jgi:hypothetical protein
MGRTCISPHTNDTTTPQHHHTHSETRQSQNIRNGTASARTSDPGASIGRVLGRTIRMRGAYQPSIGLRGAENVAKNFFDVAKSFSHVVNRRPCNIQRWMLRACCERVPSMLRTRLHATSNIGRLSSTSPTCCDHVATML